MAGPSGGSETIRLECVCGKKACTTRYSMDGIQHSTLVRIGVPGLSLGMRRLRVRDRFPMAVSRDPPRVAGSGYAHRAIFTHRLKLARH